MKLAHVIPFAAAFLVPAFAAAQACPDGTPEGEASPDNACLICHAGDWISLPERTACGADRSLQCDATRVYRLECVPTAADPDVTECIETSRWDECPNGLQCDTAGGICRRFCATNADCRPGFECDADTCVAVSEPDMGGGGDDMGGGEPDMGQVGEDMGGESDMGSRIPDAGGFDLGGGWDGEIYPKRDAGGCASVDGRASLGSLFAILFLMIRRRSH